MLLNGKSRSTYEPGVSSLAIALALTLAAQVCRLILLQSNLELTSFRERIIGIAVLEAVNTPGRTALYVTLVAAFFACLLIGYYLFSWIFQSTSRQSWSRHVSIERSALFVFASFSCLNIFLEARNQFEVAAYRQINIFLLLLIGLTLALSIVKEILLHQKGCLPGFLQNYNILLLALFLPAALFFPAWFLLQIQPFFKPADILIYLILVPGFLLLYSGLLRAAKRRSIARGRLDRAVLLGSLPLLALPAAMTAAKDLLFALRNYGAPPKLVIAVLIALFFAASLVVFSFALSRTFSFRQARLITNGIFPLFILTNVLLQFFPASAYVEMFDMFHDGENLLPVQQLFQFGKLPYIDIFPTHGLSDFPQLLYSLVFGYRPVEPWLWNWMRPAILLIVLYFLLKRYMAPLAALLFVLVTPVFQLFSDYYLAVIIPALLVPWIARPERARHFAIYWFGCLMVLLYRLDFGIAALAGSFFILGVELFSRLACRDHRGAARLLVRAGVPLAGIYGAAFALYLLAIAARGASVKTVLHQNLLFLQMQDLSMSYATLGSFSEMTIVLYILLPAVGIFYLFRFFQQRMQAKTAPGPEQYGLVFLAATTLVLSTRGVQRHSLAEVFNPILFLFLAVMLPYFIVRSRQRLALSASLAIYAASVLLPQQPVLPILRTTGPYFHFENFATHYRIQYDMADVKHLVRLLQEGLAPGESFFDFTNSPMLYILSGREFQTYLIPTMYLTGDQEQEYTIAALESARISGEIPIVIFKQRKPFWDSVDGVPSEIRSYRIAEWIYTHYLPLINVDGHQVWAMRGLDPNRLLDIADRGDFRLDFINQQFELKQLPRIWAKYDEKSASQSAENQQEILASLVVIHPGQQLTLSLNPNIDKSSGSYLSIQARSADKAVITVKYGSGEGSSISFETTGGNRSEPYLIRISSQWQWMSEAVDQITLATSADVEIERVALRKGD